MDLKSTEYLCRLRYCLGRVSTISLLPLVTAALLCVCLTTERWTGLCYVALVPFAFVLAAPSISRATYASTYLSGLVVHLVGMAWVLECYRYDKAIGPYAVQWFWIGTWGGALLVAAFALGRIIMASWRLPVTILLPLLWIAYEFIRHEMADLATGTGFPWLKLGTSLVDSRYFLQVADLGGEYLLSFLVAMINGAIVDSLITLYHGRQKTCPARNCTIIAVSIAGLLVFTSLGYGHWRVNQSPGDPGPTVALMGELDLPPLLDTKRLNAATEGHQADLLLWPELAYHHAVVDIDVDARASDELHRAVSQVSHVNAGNDKRALNYLAQSAQELGSTLVIGCERVHRSKEGSRSFNSLACAGAIEGFQGCYDKVNLVPGAETAMRSADLIGATEYAYRRGEDMRLFNLSTATVAYRFAPGICYDLCFGNHYRGFPTQEADFLVQCGAEGQDKSGKIAWLMLRYARLRSVENRRALVRNVTLGHSALVDSNGVVRVALSTEPITMPTWLGAVPIDTRQSLYAIAGDWIAYLACMVTLGLALSAKPFHHAKVAQ